MRKISTTEIISVLERQGRITKKTYPYNVKIVEMLENTVLEFVGVEITPNGNYNRGTLCECIIKCVLNDYLTGKASRTYEKTEKGADFSTFKKSAELCHQLGLETNRKYEIKTHTDNRPSNNKVETPQCIYIDLRAKSLGVWLVDSVNLIWEDGNLKGYTKGVRLELVNELLGL